MTAAFLADVEIDGHRVDVAVEGGRITAVGRQVESPPGAARIEGAGGALVPGLHDHHLHLRSLAASLASVDLAAADGEAITSRLRSADARLEPGAWLRAVGYHEGGRPLLDRWQLDALLPDRPVRVQHRSGGLWVLNSAGLAATGLLDGDPPEGCETDAEGVPTGRLWRRDDLLAGRTPRASLDLATVGRLLAAHGVTGVTDATPFAAAGELDDLAAAAADGALPQRVTITGGPELDPGDVPPSLHTGPAKLLFPDHEVPSLDEVVEAIAAARRHGRDVAMHCVTRHALVLYLAALDEVGSRPGDRVEHGAMIGPDLHDSLRRLGLTVVTQPNFVAERGDAYLADVPTDELGELWPMASLLDGGVPVAIGTDAPFGRADPWAAIHAASTRVAPSGAKVNVAEAIPARRALDLVLGDARRPGGPPRRIEPGAPADLCLLGSPLPSALRDLPANPVRLTLVAGAVVHGEP